MRLVEFQAQHAPGAWYNLLTKIGLYGEAYPGRAVRGLLVFLRTADDPGPPPGAGPPLCASAYLDETLPQRLEREPDNPYVAVFAPLIIPRDEDLRACAPKAWRTIREASLEPHVRATLERMLEFWLMERFPLLTKEELRTMLPVLVPLEQTRAYQEIFAEGEALGKADGLKRLLKRRFGALPRWAVQRLDTAAIEQLDDWLEGIFDAQSLEDLLGAKPRRGVAKGS